MAGAAPDARGALEQVLRQAALGLAGVAGPGCEQATHAAQVERGCRIATRRQLAEESRALAKRLDPQRQEREAKVTRGLAARDRRLALAVLDGLAAHARFARGRARQRAAASIQSSWRGKLVRKPPVPPPPPSPYEQLRSLLTRHPELRRAMFSACTADSAGDKPSTWQLLTAEPDGAAPPARPRRHTARCSLRKLERYLLTESETRQELLELLGDLEMSRLAVLAKLDSTRQPENAADLTASSGAAPEHEDEWLDSTISGSPRVGHSPPPASLRALSELRATEPAAAADVSIRQRVHARQRSFARQRARRAWEDSMGSPAGHDSWRDLLSDESDADERAALRAHLQAISDEQLASPSSGSAQAESPNPPRGRRRRRKASKRLRRRGVGLGEERARSVETVIQHGRFEAIAQRTK